MPDPTTVTLTLPLFHADEDEPAEFAAIRSAIRGGTVILNADIDGATTLSRRNSYIGYSHFADMQPTPPIARRRRHLVLLAVGIAIAVAIIRKGEPHA